MMPMSRRGYFVAKHDLASIEAMPDCIWNTEEDGIPHGYRMIRPGDRWVMFAYTSSDRRERALSMVTGFYECIRPIGERRCSLPRKARETCLGSRLGWVIAGREHGRQPNRFRRGQVAPVTVRPIDTILGRPTFKQATLTPISRAEYERIRQETLRRQLDPRRIPLLGREPRSEQELFAATVFGHRALGIRRFLRVQQAFPDLLVELANGPKGGVHMELELYSSSFLSHGHQRQARGKRFDGKPVAILCWTHDDPAVAKHVQRVYELQSLIRDCRKIVW
jgi:hypothetical protein